MSARIPHPGLVLAALIAVQVLFGVNYVFSKIVVEAFPPLVWGTFRLFIAAGFLLFLGWLGPQKHPRGWKFFGPLIGLALLGAVINQGSFLVGLSYTTATNSAILNTLIPVFTLLIVTLRKQETFSVRKAVGFLSAFLGVLVIRKVEEFTLSNQSAVGDLLMVLNCLSYALFLSYGKPFLSKNDPLWTTAWLFAYGTLGLGCLAVPDFQSFQMPLLTGELVACALFAIFGGTFLTYFLNNWALSYAKSSHVALWIYIQPVIAATMGYFWFGEVVTMRTLASAAFIFFGLFLGITEGRPRKRKNEVVS